MDKKFIVIAGNIGSGKTTLTKLLGESFDWRAHFESVTDNPYLEDFYQNMDRWSFPLQIYFLNHRFDTHRKIESSHDSAIQDRSIYEDANIFARALFEQGHLSERDYKNYLTLYQSMTQFLTPPDLIVFLKRSVGKLEERIKLRGRDYEQAIPRDYLIRLNGYYEDWFRNYNLGKSIIIDTENMDFLKNREDLSQIKSMIAEELSIQTQSYLV